ncbi:MAG: leucine-rich repeat domain-containing protein [Prevotella sp.]|nr:leucine-rich repeat domain-containing protein [Prevotella sp.]
MKKHLLFLVFALLPMFTMADEGGTCGKDVSYSFETATGTLTIQGTGDMKNYNFTLTPWRSYRSDILVVIIKDGVTNVGNSAFFDCSALSFVSIPNSVTSIGDRAFFGCTSLADVEISDNVTSIGNSAFRDCTGLTSVTIGSGVKKIGNYAFSSGVNLSSINVNMNIPIEIDESVFEYTGGNYSSNIIYLAATLNVPTGTKALYSNVASWKNFMNIQEPEPEPEPEPQPEPSAINNVNGNATSSTYYTVGGAQLKNAQRGLNIVRMSDGTTRKVMVK